MVAAEGRFPDFVGIGAQKAGTSWLHENLSGHPGIWLPPAKELHYFDRLHVDGHREQAEQRRAMAMRRLQSDDPRQRAAAQNHLDLAAPLTDEWYASMFAPAPQTSLCGDITPAYALLPSAGVDHLLRLAPDVRLLILVRDPIDRAWSQLRMRMRPGMPLPPVSDEGIGPDVLSRSTYSATLKTYRDRVSEDRLWIGDFERLITEPAALLGDVCAFLGVGYDERTFPKMHERLHVGPAVDIDAATHDRLKRALAPEYEALAVLLPEQAERWAARHYG